MPRNSRRGGPRREQPKSAADWFGMRKHAVLFGLTFLGLAVFSAFAGWAFYATWQMGGGWRSFQPILPFVLGGGVVTALLAAGLLWLAFYSANHGYDDRSEEDRP